ncbi:MAG TPA: hypothetical protein VMV57_14610 [Terracidiphilus sp.]|nr:hypothetical protein [Terracidiphilus sp.]
MPIPQRLVRFALVLSLGALCLAALPARAQLPKGDLFFGYSRTGNDAFYPNVGGLNGWEASGYLKIQKPFLGVEADVSHYGLGANAVIPRTTLYLFGPRVTVGFAGVHLFAHGLVGGEHSVNTSASLPVSANALTYALGGGLDVPLAPFFGWRVQGDRIWVPSLPSTGGTPARFSTGIVFRF